MAAGSPVISPQDQQVLDSLRAKGSDLSKPHPIQHYLYFHAQRVAEQAGLELQAVGYKVIVRPAAKGNDWLVLASNVVVPTPTAIAEAVGRMDNVAATFRGEYDGWEAAIVK